MATTPETMTLEESLALPEEKPALEYEDERVTQKAPPDIPHSIFQPTLAVLINAFGRPRRLAFAFTEARRTLPRYSRVRDIVVYRWDCIPIDEQGQAVHGTFSEPPDITVEIISPGQIAVSQLQRCEEFIAAGVAVALLVDPDDCSVVVVRRDRTLHVVRGAARIDLDEELPGFELTAEQLFASSLHQLRQALPLPSNASNLNQIVARWGQTTSIIRSGME
ncbi:MAG: hypothetical protein QOF51_162 [Chloroflexota bacterium]|jgi:Uma2 family endonuclease|nr:hypothetical protein [Chloroflexota bacterium]